MISRWSMPSPRLMRSSLPPRGFSGVPIEPKMGAKPRFPVVLGCAARQSRRTAKSGIKKNQWVRISIRNRRRTKTGGFAGFSLARACARCKNSIGGTHDLRSGGHGQGIAIVSPPPRPSDGRCFYPCYQVGVKSGPESIVAHPMLVGADTGSRNPGVTALRAVGGRTCQSRVALSVIRRRQKPDPR
jgi:hypothetical protein